MFFIHVVYIVEMLVFAYLWTLHTVVEQYHSMFCVVSTVDSTGLNSS